MQIEEAMAKEMAATIRRRGTLRMQIEVSASEIKSEKKADDRGRVTLGSEFAGKTVTVAVLEVKDEDDVRTDGGTRNRRRE